MRLAISLHFSLHQAAMDSTTSKVFGVIVMNCKNRSHADNIATLLRESFPHRTHCTSDKPQIGFSMMVKADSRTSIQKAISSALGKGRVVFAEDWDWLGNDGKFSHEPPPYERFQPPIK
jgi:hypothetical protein